MSDIYTIHIYTYTIYSYTYDRSFSVSARLECVRGAGRGLSGSSPKLAKGNECQTYFI